MNKFTKIKNDLSHRLLEKDYKVVEKKKIYFLIPIAFLVLAIIMGIIFGVTRGSPFNISMAFTGGQSVDIILGTRLTDDNAQTYREEIYAIVGRLHQQEGVSEEYRRDIPAITMSETIQQGAIGSETASIRLQFNSSDIAADDTDTWDIINELLTEELNHLFAMVPRVTSYGSNIIVEYDSLITTSTEETRLFGAIREAVAAFNGGTIVLSADGMTYGRDSEGALSDSILVIPFSGTGDIPYDAIAAALAVSDPFSIDIRLTGFTSPTMAREFLITAILAILLMLTLLLIYIAFRFEVASGLATIISIFHDLIMIMAFMTIFNIEIGQTFIAAIITILAYTINNNIITFDRIRENIKSKRHEGKSNTFLANTAVRETILRTINTTVTTALVLGALAIIGVPAIQVFTLPLLFGILAGAYSTIFISPTAWVMLKDFAAKRITGKVTAPTKPIKAKQEN
ncbi:MAG: protein translocase subunit SecF [Firmicutes bacterium]|nr:protein translocase subunit SecF [Bacillota bacterium]